MNECAPFHVELGRSSFVSAVTLAVVVATAARGAWQPAEPWSHRLVVAALGAFGIVRVVSRAAAARRSCSMALPLDMLPIEDFRKLRLLLRLGRLPFARD